MKYFLFSIFALLSTYGFSQIRIAIDEEINDTSGYTLEYVTDIALSNAHLFDLGVHNESDFDQNWIITRRVISTTEGWTNYICWGPSSGGGTCYGPNGDLEWSSGSFPIESGESGTLSIYINAPFAGTSLCRYYVSTDGINFLDSIDVRVNQTVGLSVLEAPYKIAFYPNPAIDAIQVTVPNIGSYQMEIFDLQGKLMKRVQLEKSTSFVDVSAIAAGSYLLLFKNEQGVQVVEKLIIK